MVGEIHALLIKEKRDKEFILVKGTEEIALPFLLTDKELTVGDIVDVFIYREKRGNLVATTALPHIVFGGYGWVDVVETLANLGAFVHIGTSTDVLVSMDELPLQQQTWPEPGDTLYVSLQADKKGRLLAVPAKEMVFEDMYNFMTDLELNDEVKGRIIRVDEEGAVMITDNKERGFIHHSEYDVAPRLGEYVIGRVIEVKEDGTLNVSLLPLKHERITGDAKSILTHIEESGGLIPFGDKSDPDVIRETFNMSKSAFKRALGHLMKIKKVEQRDGKTHLRK